MNLRDLELRLSKSIIVKIEELQRVAVLFCVQMSEGDGWMIGSNKK